MKNFFFILYISTFLVSIAQVKNVFHFKLEGEINAVSSRYTELAIDKAHTDSADLILMEMNTFGGVVFDAESIVDDVLESKIPVWVYINKNAGSAGSFISVACDSIFMAKGAFIGASSVINANGEILPEKIQSAMRSKFRTVAEATHKDPDLCELFVGKNLTTDSAFVLSLTTKEAIDSNLCMGEYDSVEALLKANGGTNYIKSIFEISSVDVLISWLIHPGVKSFLILLIMGGIFFELKSPGIGFPIIVAFMGVMLYFIPDYLHGLLEHWEFLLFLGGLVLIALEVFVVPGFGITGISGIVCVISGLVLSMVQNKGFDFDYVSADSLANAFIVLVVGIVSSLGAVVAGFSILIKSKTFKKLTVTESIDEKAFDVNLDLIGKEGIVFSVLRLSGKIEVDGRLYDAQSIFGHIDKGERVKIVSSEGIMLKVKKVIDNED